MGSYRLHTFSTVYSAAQRQKWIAVPLRSQLMANGARAVSQLAGAVDNLQDESPKNTMQNGPSPPPYQMLLSRLESVRKVVGKTRPLSLAEKILLAHCRNIEQVTATAGGYQRGETLLPLHVDRVSMQDASAQMALLQFMTCGLPSSKVSASIHCDHLIVARDGAAQDLEKSIQENAEIFSFLQSCAKRFGIDFWKPGSGIIHQIVLENYAAPGAMLLGTDSHTPNAGGLSTLAIGVGGADAVDAMTDTAWELTAPRIIGVNLKGSLNGWASPKDVILNLAGKLTVRGGTGHIIEYFGDGTQSLSATGMATICNMGAEVGATTSIFPYTCHSASYLRATGRALIADSCDRIMQQGLRSYLAADPGVEYDQVIEIDLSTIEPHINGPFTPDLSTPLSHFGEKIKDNDWPQTLSAGLIGSCTNSSYEDMTKAANIVKQALDAGLKPEVSLLVTPGSEQIRSTIQRDGLTEIFEQAGAKVLANACGPCIGMWDRSENGIDVNNQPNAVLTSFNRNFKGRNDGNVKTMNFLASPEIVASKIFSKDLAFDPVHSEIIQNGKSFKFSPPVGVFLPQEGFDSGKAGYKPEFDPAPQPGQQIEINSTSNRLEKLEPFEAWDCGELAMTVAVKVKGKCTTDHISAAGKWLKYKGHLSNICKNTLMGAQNAEDERANSAYDGNENITIPELLFRLKERGQPWMVVAEHNYGEGSAREHAALQPRALNGRAVLAKSFARIHETNLKKQGILPFTFKNESDYDLISAGDKVETRGLVEFITGDGRMPTMHVIKPDSRVIEIPIKCVLSPEQKKFFRAGSALNLIRSKAEVEQHNSTSKNADPNLGAITPTLIRRGLQAVQSTDECTVSEKVQSDKLKDMIGVMKSQPRLWAEFYIYRQRFLVTEGDKFTIPVSVKSLEIGDSIALEKVTKIGSRDLTLQGHPLLNTNLYDCQATVIQKTKSSLIEHLKHRRRRRHVRRVVQKQPYTVLR